MLLRTTIVAIIATILALSACSSTPDGWSEDKTYFKVTVVHERGAAPGQKDGKCADKSVRIDESFSGTQTIDGDHYTVKWNSSSRGSSSEVSIVIESARQFVSGFVHIKEQTYPFVLPLAMHNGPVGKREVVVKAGPYSGVEFPYGYVTAVTLCDDPTLR